MKALLIKDWRLNVPAARGLLVIYAIVPPLIFATRAVNEGTSESLAWNSISVILLISALAGLCISLLFVAAFGAIAFARERRDRSAEFLGSLPVSRSRVVLSKGIVTCAVAILPWLVSGVLLGLAMIADAQDVSTDRIQLSAHEVAEAAWWIFQIELMILGVSWLLSSLLRSEVLAAAATVLTGILLALAYVMYRTRLERFGIYSHAETEANLLATVTLFSLGIGGLIAGTIVSLRRISP